MSKHHNSKAEQEVGNGAVFISSRGAHIDDQTHFSNGDGGEAEIARLAYSYWEARGCADGSAEEDWVRAKQTLRA